MLRRLLSQVYLTLRAEGFGKQMKDDPYFLANFLAVSPLNAFRCLWDPNNQRNIECSLQESLSGVDWRTRN